MDGLSQSVGNSELGSIEIFRPSLVAACGEQDEGGDRDRDRTVADVGHGTSDCVA